MNEAQAYIRPPADDEKETVLRLHKDVFGRDEEADLVAGLLDDPTAQPTTSISAFKGEEMVGHIMVSRAALEGAFDAALFVILPLALTPEAAEEGAGEVLVESAMLIAAGRQVDLVFATGDPAFYEPLDFKSIEPFDFELPAPPPGQSWMVLDMAEGATRRLSGKVLFPNTFAKVGFWQD